VSDTGGITQGLNCIVGKTNSIPSDYNMWWLLVTGAVAALEEYIARAE